MQKAWSCMGSQTAQWSSKSVHTLVLNRRTPKSCLRHQKGPWVCGWCKGIKVRWLPWCQLGGEERQEAEAVEAAGSDGRVPSRGLQLAQKAARRAAQCLHLCVAQGTGLCCSKSHLCGTLFWQQHESNTGNQSSWHATYSGGIKCPHLVRSQISAPISELPTSFSLQKSLLWEVCGQR